MNWLFKEEPSHYSFSALTADGGTVWSGVKNPVAQKHLHAVKKGDRIFYYHSGTASLKCKMGNEEWEMRNAK